MPVKIFFSYAHEDKALLEELKKHLRSLERRSEVEFWYDQDIIPGTEYEPEIEKHLNTAQIILLLISPDFIDSDYSYGIEMERAMERHERGEVRVIPIILRHTWLRGTPFEKLEALPPNARPVKSWRDQDEAFFKVTDGIYKAVIELQSRVTATTVSTQESVQIPTPAGIGLYSETTKARQEMNYLIQDYGTIRLFIPPTRSKTRFMESVRKSMQSQAQQAGYTPSEITSFLLSLDEGERLAGLAILQARKDIDPQNVDNFEQVISLMEKPRNPYEHYHTLEALKGMKPHLSDQQRDKLRDAVRNHIYDFDADSAQWPAFCKEILGEDSNECR